MRPIAVLHVTSAEGGGADRHLRDLAATTDARHWIWHAAARIVEDASGQRFRNAPDDTALVHWLAAAGIGLVHLHGVTRDDIAVLARVRAARALPYVVTLHDIAFVAPRAFEGSLDIDAGEIARVAGTLAQAERVVAPSSYVAALVGEHFERVGVDVIAPGIDCRAQPVGPPAREAGDAFAAHAHPRRIAVVGALGAHKGSADLVAIAHSLHAQQTTLVVIGYTDTRLEPGWQVQGELFVHGAYEDHALPALLDLYGVDTVLFANRVPESFSYTLSEAWGAGRPVIVPDAGALGARVAQSGGGWRLPAAHEASDVAALCARLATPDGAREWAQVKSVIDADDPLRVPTLANMTAQYDALYARYALPAGAADDAADALAPLVAANLDGRVFRRELVRLTGELHESREWRAKLERDIAELKAAVEGLGEDNRKLADVRDAFVRLPHVVQKYLLKQAFRDRR